MDENAFYLEFGRQLRARRRDRGLTQRSLARRIGATQATISNFEHGRRAPSLFTAMQLVAFLECPLGLMIPSDWLTLTQAIRGSSAAVPRTSEEIAQDGELVWHA